MGRGFKCFLSSFNYRVDYKKAVQTCYFFLLADSVRCRCVFCSIGAFRRLNSSRC